MINLLQRLTFQQFRYVEQTLKTFYTPQIRQSSITHLNKSFFTQQKQDKQEKQENGETVQSQQELKKLIPSQQNPYNFWSPSECMAWGRRTSLITTVILGLFNPSELIAVIPAIPIYYWQWKISSKEIKLAKQIKEELEIDQTTIGFKIQGVFQLIFGYIKTTLWIILISVLIYQIDKNFNQENVENVQEKQENQQQNSFQQQLKDQKISPQTPYNIFSPSECMGLGRRIRIILGLLQPAKFILFMPVYYWQWQISSKEIKEAKQLKEELGIDQTTIGFKIQGGFQFIVGFILPNLWGRILWTTIAICLTVLVQPLENSRDKPVSNDDDDKDKK